MAHHPDFDQPSMQPPPLPPVRVPPLPADRVPPLPAARMPVHLSVAKIPLRILGALALSAAIVIPSCQAVFPRDSGSNAPQQLSPGSFGESR